MIQVKRGQANELILTVTEKTTIENAFYLFELIEDQTGESSFLILTKNSSATCRYDSFTLTEPTDFDFKRDGFWSYIVRQQTSDSNLDPLLAEGIVEEGRINVYSDSTSGIEYDNEDTAKVYGE